MSILIVEDNPVNAKLLGLMLGGEGYQTVVARNGKEALAMLSQTPGIELIITDYMMPEMDGLEFIMKVRAVSTFHAVPILIASAHGELEIVKRAKELHCDGFLVKPIDKTDLIKRVKQLLHTQQPVLLDKHIVMGRLECGPEDYLALINEFAGQVAAIMPIVLLEQGDSNERISENLSRLLNELVESATTLGAHKLVHQYGACKGMGPLTRSHCYVLFKTLQEVEAALLACPLSQPKAVRGTNAA